MKVVVVGGGLSGYRCICSLRAHYPDAELFLVDKSKIPVNKTVMADWLSDKENTAISLFDSDFFETKNVTFVNDIAVRVNFDRNRIFFKNEKSLPYDKLIIASGLGSGDLNFSGQNKEGVCSLWADDIFEIKTAIKLYQNIVLSVSSPIGLLCAKSIIEHHKRDFKLIITNSSFLSESEKNEFIRYAAEKNVEVFENTHIVEAIGDTALKAVKLSIGKFLVANILIAESNLRPELSLFKENEDKLQDGGLIYDEFLNLPSYDNVYFVGNLVNTLWANYRNYPLSDEVRNASANYVVNSIAKGRSEAFDFSLFETALSQDVGLDEFLGIDFSNYSVEEQVVDDE